MGRGRGGGGVKSGFTHAKRGAEKVLAKVKWMGGTTCYEVVLTPGT